VAVAWAGDCFGAGLHACLCPSPGLDIPAWSQLNPRGTWGEGGSKGGNMLVGAINFL
jgi:hypothetical protein